MHKQPTKILDPMPITFGDCGQKLQNFASGTLESRVLVRSDCRAFLSSLSAAWRASTAVSGAI